MSQRFVLDTNVVISALIWRGIPAKPLIAAGENQITLCTSDALIRELAKKLATPKLAKAIQSRGINTGLLLPAYLALCEVVICTELPNQICRDPDDDWVLATALAAKANIIVSGDQDLLVLHPYLGIEILNSAQASEKLVSSGKVDHV